MDRNKDQGVYQWLKMIDNWFDLIKRAAMPLTLNCVFCIWYVHECMSALLDEIRFTNKQEVVKMVYLKPTIYLLFFAVEHFSWGSECVKVVVPNR